MPTYQFDDANRSISITDPNLPAPWINYLSNGSMHSFVSQSGGSSLWWRSPINFRITRYRDWSYFCSWIRTIRPGIPPSEQIVSMALRHRLPEFLAGASNTPALAKFIKEHLNLDRAEGMRLAA
jgi:hypothetical protein